MTTPTPSRPRLILQQELSSEENRAVRLAAIVTGVPTRLVNLRDPVQLRGVDWRQTLPVGSVEFVREAMGLAGFLEPTNISYPEALHPFLRRAVWRARPETLALPCFVKPLETKSWTGRVVTTREGLPRDFEVWASQLVEWQSEWRYYIADGEILGSARYDEDGEDDAEEPVLDVVWEMIEAYGRESPYALDVGVLADGRTALVECNDFWALGLYGGCLYAQQYLDCLWRRWQEIAASSRWPTAENECGAPAKKEGPA